MDDYSSNEDTGVSSSPRLNKKGDSYYSDDNPDTEFGGRVKDVNTVF